MVGKYSIAWAIVQEIIGKYSVAWAIVREIFEIFLIVRTIVMQIVGLFLFVWAIVGKCTKYFMAIVPKHFLRLLYYEGNCDPQFPATRRGKITKKIFPPIPVDTDKPFISLPTIKSR